MKEIKVTASNPYSVLIGAGIMKDFKALCGDIISGKRLAVVTDDTVDSLYFDALGLDGALKFVFPHGEESKNMDTLSDILEFLADNNFTRSDVLIALGGGALSNPFVDDSTKEKIGFKVWLDTDDKIAFERIMEKGLPPFLQESENPELAFKEMNIARKAVFASQCDVRCVPAATPHYTALHILSLYKDKWL